MLALFPFSPAALGSDPPEPGTSPSSEALAAHREEVEAWRQERHDRLRHRDGWLSLAGLFWLIPGGNTVGSGEENDVALPASAPENVGVIRYDPGTGGGAASYRLDLAEGVEVVVDGATVRGGGGLAEKSVGLSLMSDSRVPAVVELGPVVFYVIERTDRVGIRVRDAESPVLTGFEGIESFPVSWDWRLWARYRPHDPPKVVAIPNAIGTVNDLESPGRVEFEHDGRSFGIDVLPGADDHEIWLVFGDRTNRTSTYGGGRFLYADIEPENLRREGPVILDFNRAYNPPCAFTPYATCPLPPPENRLDLAIEAGEKRYTGGRH